MSHGLVRALHLGDGEPGLRRHGEHLGRRAEGIGHPDRAGFALRRFQLALGQHEAAADGIIGLLQIKVARGIRGPEHQAVGVAGQGGAVVEDQIRLGVEGHLWQAGRGQAAGLLDPGEHCGGAGGVEIVWREAREAEDHRAVGGVALAGEGEAAVEPRAEPGRLAGAGNPVGAAAQEVEEPPRRDHRPHGVARGRPDPQLEDVEDAQKHRPLPDLRRI